MPNLLTPVAFLRRFVHGGIGRQQKACHRPDKAADYKIISVGNTYIPPIALLLEEI
jgi:hypothetical protein